MGRLFRKHNRFILILIILVLFLIVFNLASSVFPQQDWGQNLIIDFFSPFLGSVNLVYDNLRGAFKVLFNYREVKQENMQLKRRVKKLEWEVQQLKEIAKENKRLRKLVNFKERTNFGFVGAKVIGKSADNWSRIVTINRGRKSGLEPKMLVVTYNGYLVGKVKEVTTYNAQVLLLNDSNFNIGGLVSREDSREIGIVSGRLNQPESLNLNKLPWDAEIESGDEIVTSGLSEAYPKGVLIGKVLRVEPEDYGLTRSAIVDPFVDLNTFEEVLIITEF